MNFPGASPLGCTPCTLIASFQEHICSPTSPQPSLPPHFSNAYSCSSFLNMSETRSWGFFWWADALEHLGFFSPVSQLAGLCPAPGRGISQPQLPKPAHGSPRGEVLGCWCTNWLWLVHGVFGSSSMNCMGIHSCMGWWGAHCQNTSLSYVGAHAMKCWSAQAWPDRIFKHTLIGHLCTTNWVLMHVPAGQPCTDQLCAHALINWALMNKLMGYAQTYWALMCVLIGHSCINWVLMHELLDHSCINFLAGVHGWSNFALVTQWGPHVYCCGTCAWTNWVLLCEYHKPCNLCLILPFLCLPKPLALWVVWNRVWIVQFRPRAELGQ